MDNFRAGDCYYRLSFLDGAMTRPIVETLVYVGLNLSADDKQDTWYFQDVHSYSANGPAHESGVEGAQVHCYCKEDTGGILDLSGLAREISEVAGRTAAG